MNHPEYESDGVRLIQGDCLDVMRTLEPGSVDLILADLPYGTTACKWDVVIPFEPLWECYRRLLKPRGAVVLTASQPFTSMLVMSNLEWFKYCLVWEKTRVSGFAHAKNKPMKSHEDVAVFSPATTVHASQTAFRMTYNPQGLMPTNRPHKGVRKPTYGNTSKGIRPSDHAYIQEASGYPKSVIKTKSEYVIVHPTQKPVALFEYLIKTYSNEGELILDNTIGSGTTAVAAINTGRRCIGIERDPGYFETAVNRVKATRLPLLPTGTT